MTISLECVNQVKSVWQPIPEIKYLLNELHQILHSITNATDMASNTTLALWI